MNPDVATASPMTIGPVSVELDPPDEPDPPVERIRRHRR
jgi:hypothetical protein